MKKLLEFFKNLFHENPFELGAQLDAVDPRAIPVTAFMPTVSVPPSYKAQLSAMPVFNQLQIPDCVWNVAVQQKMYYILLKTGKLVFLSRRMGYKWSKLADGIPDLPGTFPTVAANIALKKGIPEVTLVDDDHTLSYNQFMNITDSPAILENASKYKIAGYAYVPADLSLIKQALFQYGVLGITTNVDSGWFSGFITRVLKSIGLHRTLLYGYDEFGNLYCRNSWGAFWGTKGDFVLKWEDYKDNIFDIIAFADIPEDLLDKAKNTPYKFMNNLRMGSSGQDVVQLQKYLNSKGGKLVVDGKFGIKLQAELIMFQRSNGLTADGIFGNNTRAFINGGVSKLDLWCEAIKQMEGAKPYRNNPGNLRFVGQQYAVNDNGFCKFDTYDHGYEALKSLLIRACTGLSSVYNPNMDLVAFYHVYAPSSDGNNPDGYAKFVGSKIGVPITTKIKDLI